MGSTLPTIPLTREFLFQAYWQERRSILSIARQVGCRNDRVLAALREFELDRPHVYVTKDWMLEHYVQQQQTIDEIAAQLGVDESQVRYYLRGFAIPIRYKSRGSVRVPLLHDHAWLSDQYLTQHLSACAIADLLCCAESSVISALERHGILRRKHKGQKVYKSYYRRNFSATTKIRILKRDQHRCQMPGCAATDHLEVHHIIPLRLRGASKVSNGITLCESCHLRTKGCEESFALLFWSIIAS